MKNKTSELNLIDTVEGLEAAGIKKIVVKYKPFIINNTKDFDLYQWVIFKKGIIDNLFSKGRCKISYQ